MAERTEIMRNEGRTEVDLCASVRNDIVSKAS